MTPVVNAGLVENTTALEPVSSDKADARLALDGVCKNAATPVPRPETPVLIGNPVQLVKVPADGVPMFGVVRAGLVAKTTLPVPVAAFHDGTPADVICKTEVAEAGLVSLLSVFEADAYTTSPVA